MILYLLIQLYYTPVPSVLQHKYQILIHLRRSHLLALAVTDRPYTGRQSRNCHSERSKESLRAINNHLYDVKIFFWSQALRRFTSQDDTKNQHHKVIDFSLLYLQY